MWGHQQPFNFGWQQQWPGMAQHNPTPQSTDPVEWAAKAAQWAQQKQVQDQYYTQMAAQAHEQQQQLMASQAMQQTQAYGYPQHHSQMLEQQQQQQLVAGGGGVVGMQAEFAQANEGQTPQSAFHQQQQQQQQQQPVRAEPLLPKPLFDTPPGKTGPTRALLPQRALGTPERPSEEQGGFEDPSFHKPRFPGSPHVGMEQRQGEEGFHEHRSPPGEHFPRLRGDFHPQRHTPRGRGSGGQHPRFSSPRAPRFRPHGERGPSPHHWEKEDRVFQGHRGPTDEKFDRGGPHGDNPLYGDDNQEHHFPEGFPPERGESERRGPRPGYVEQLEAMKKKEQEKEMEMKRELERMQNIERQRKLEVEQKLELKRKQEAERKQQETERLKALELERKRKAEEELVQRRREEELQKKRELDLRLAQEIETKKREMERMLERKERMEQELMERQEVLGRMGTGGGGGGGSGNEMWGMGEDYHSEAYHGGHERPDQPTIPSWNRDPSLIPGLGELGESPSGVMKGERATEGAKPQPNPAPRALGQEGTDAAGDEGGPQATKVMESLGKIVSQLQTLQGLTSSLKLLQKLPKDSEEGVAAAAAAAMGGGLSEVDRAAMREKELSEDTKRKVAALLANESDSDGEQEVKPKPRREGTASGEAGSAVQAREFDGTYNVQPQVYGTYSAADQYSRQGHKGQSEEYSRQGHKGQSEEYSRQGHKGQSEEYSRQGHKGQSEEYSRQGHKGQSEEEEYREEFKQSEPAAPGDSRYSKFDCAPHEGGREPRDPYGYPPEEERRYPRPLHPDARHPQDAKEGYSYPPHKSYPSFPGEHPRDMMKGDEWGRGQLPPQRMPPHEYAEPVHPVPPSMRQRPPPHPDNYRDPPKDEDPYYQGPPLEPKRGAGIFSQMESIDYSHGGSSSLNIKTVDYHHGAQAGAYAPMPREGPPPPNFPYGSPGGGYPTAYGEGMPPAEYMQFGGPGYMIPAGLDPAAIFAAYQGGESKRRTLPLWLREELEKLERKKAKQLEKEAREGSHGEGDGAPKWREELEREGEREGEERERREVRGKWEREEEVAKAPREKSRFYRQHSNSTSHSGDESPPHRKKRHYEPPEESEEDKHLSLVMKIRQMLTEVLLDVTNEEIEAVAIEAIEEARKPKLVIQMKGVAKIPSKENILGLSVYSSGSESDSEISPGNRDGKTRGRDGKSGSKSSRSRGSKDASHAVSGKLPKVEEIAAAFKDTKETGTGKDKSMFKPVPRVVQEKQKEGKSGSGSSSKQHSEGSKEREKLKEREREREAGKKVKDKHDHSRESSGRDKGKEKERDKEQEKFRKKLSEKDRDQEKEGSSSSSRKKSASSSSTRKDHDRERERERERGKERHTSSSGSSRDTSKSAPSSKSSSSRSRRHSSPLSSPHGGGSGGGGSSKSRMRSSSRRSRSKSPPMSGRHSRSRSPVLRSLTHIAELESSKLSAVPTGKGSIQTTKGFLPAFPMMRPSRAVRNRSPSPNTDAAYQLQYAPKWN